MFIAHLPAGYIASKLLFPGFGAAKVPFATFLAAGLLGAVAPDLDLAWFYLVDNRQHHHHTYFTHWPIFWLVLIGISWIWFAWNKSAAPALAFSANGFVHMCLDTMASEMWWLAPFSDQSIQLLTVPALYKPWWLNFLMHWSMLVELAIVVTAISFWSIGREKERTA